jgi:hypothetical protein
VHRDPDRRRLDDLVVGEGSVEVGRVEAGEPVPEREVWRRRLLRLQGDDTADRFDRVQRFAAEEELPAERGPG